MTVTIKKTHAPAGMGKWNGLRLTYCGAWTDRLNEKPTCLTCRKALERQQQQGVGIGVI